MTKDEEFKLLKIQTCILRVNLHCDGCKHKVKKLLQRIDGVYQVNIDAEQQKVTVSGSVDSATLIKKLVRAGKHAELWSNKSNETHNQNQSQNHQNQKGSCVKDDKKNKAQKQDFLKALESLKNQQKLQPFISEEDDDIDDNIDDDIDDNIDDEKHAVVAAAANNARKSNNNNINNNNNSNNNGKPHNGGSVEKGSLNQNGGVKMSNNINLGGGKRVNDTRSVVNNLDGFGGGGFSNLGGLQVPQKNTVLGSSGAGFQLPNGGIQKNTVLGSSGAGFQLPNGGLPVVTSGYYPSSQAAAIMNMNGGGQQQPHNNAAASAAAASMMMNMNRQAMQHQHQHQHQQQPQMMYNRSPVITPATGYYYGYNPAPYTYNEHPHNYYYTAANGGGGNGGYNSAAHMFSDENTSSCSVM